jgi:hypothetical protein
MRNRYLKMMPAWVDIEMAVSLFELYEKFEKENENFKKKYGEYCYFTTHRLREISKLYKYLYNKEIKSQ